MEKANLAKVAYWWNIEKGSFSVREILRKGPEFKRFIQGKKLEDSEILDLMVKHPGLLQRPIIVDRTNAFIARDKESLESVWLIFFPKG